MGTGELRRGEPVITVGGKEIVLAQTGGAAGAGVGGRTGAGLAASIGRGAAVDQRGHRPAERRALWASPCGKTSLLAAVFVLIALVVTLGLLLGVRLSRKG